LFRADACLTAVVARDYAVRPTAMTAASIGATTRVVTLAIVLAGCSQTPTSPSSATISVTGLPGAAVVGQPVAILSYQSEPGDYIGQGQTETFHLTGTQFQVTADPSGSQVQFAIPPSGGTWWRLTLQSPSGALSPGYYNNATRWPFQLAGVPGLDFSGSGRGCNQSTGRFLVAAAAFSGSQVERFHARFEQHCEGFSVALRGQIWIDASGAAPPPLPHCGQSLAVSVNHLFCCADISPSVSSSAR
jgi:hypothetical protein